MRIDLRGKVIVVTGAGSGLGANLAEGLVTEGALVAILARTAAKAQATAVAIASRRPGSPAPLPVVADVTNERQVQQAADEVYSRWGRLDALINNAALIPPATSVLETSVEDFREVLNTNVVGSLVTTQHFAPIMIRGGGGRIVFLSSVISEHANPGQASYGASKAAVNVLSQVVHRELSHEGIRTVALAPGLLDTPGMRASVSPERIAAVAETYPHGRLGQPEDLLPTVAFLCSEGADHISGVFVPTRPIALAR